jgi:hypothetical protein
MLFLEQIMAGTSFLFCCQRCFSLSISLSLHSSSKGRSMSTGLKRQKRGISCLTASAEGSFLNDGYIIFVTIFVHLKKTKT